MISINKELLQKMVDEGFVYEIKHPTLNLYIYNYSRKCTYEKMWNEVTLLCRGLVLDGEKNIVSLPLGKFFNFEEFGPERIESELRGHDYRVYNKADGCLDESTLIYTELGYKTIKWICDKKYTGNVLSYNTILKVYEWKPIIAHSVKENIQNWFRLTLENDVVVLITGNQQVWCSNIQAYRRVDELDGTEDIVYEKCEKFQPFHKYIK